MRAFEDVLRDVARAATRDLTLPPGAAARALAGARRTRRRRWVGSGAAVLVVTLAVTLGLVLPAGQSSVATVTSAHQQDGLAAEATRLLTLVDLPPGARPTTQRPPHLPVPPTEPNVSGLVNRSRLVAVPLSLSASVEFLRTHTPRGLQVEGLGGRISGPGLEVDYGSWFDPSPAGQGTAQLLISIEAVGPNSTVWGLDGQVYPPGAPGVYSQGELLRPHYPNGVSNCAGYEVNITTRQGTTPLASCAGLVGLNPLPAVSVAVGDQVLMTSQSSGATWSAAPSGILAQSGATFTALRRGSADITARNVDCLPSPAGGAQPSSCAVIRVTVS